MFVLHFENSFGRGGYPNDQPALLSPFLICLRNVFLVVDDNVYDDDDCGDHGGYDDDVHDHDGLDGDQWCYKGRWWVLFGPEDDDDQS